MMDAIEKQRRHSRPQRANKHDEIIRLQRAARQIELECRPCPDEGAKAVHRRSRHPRLFWQHDRLRRLHERSGRPGADLITNQ